MSENLDLVRSIYAAWERGNFGHVEWAHPDIEYTGVDGLSPGTSRGIQAMGADWREFVADWSGFRAEAEEYRELDDERVLVLHRFVGRGRGAASASLRCGARERRCFGDARARAPGWSCLRPRARARRPRARSIGLLSRLRSPLVGLHHGAA